MKKIEKLNLQMFEINDGANDTDSVKANSKEFRNTSIEDKIAPPGSGIKNTDEVFSGLFLKTLTVSDEDYQYCNHAMNQVIGKRSGVETYAIRISPFEVVQTASVLPEGQPNEPLKFSNLSTQIGVAQYGAHFKCTDVLDETVHIDYKERYSVELARHAKELRETIAIHSLTNSGTKKWAGGHSSDDEITVDDVLSVEECLKEIIRMGDRFIRKIPALKAYKVIYPFTAHFDLMKDETFEKYMNFGNTNAPLHSGVMPVLFDMVFYKTRFYETKENGSNIQVTTTFILGEEYGVNATLTGNAPKFISKDFGSAGTEDPLNQVATYGYKFWYGFTVLTPLAITELRHTLTVEGK